MASVLKQVVYVAASPYSGSTLLDLLLGQQAGCLSLGEVHRLGMPPFERVRSFGNRCSCRSRLHDCAHWEPLRVAMAHSAGVPSTLDWSDWGVTPAAAWSPSLKSRFARCCIAVLPARHAGFRHMLWSWRLFREHRVAANRSWTFFSHLASATGRQTLIDSTKTATRLFALWYQNPKRLRVIHIVRDGRGVSHSFLKRSRGTFEASVESWKSRTKPLLRILAHIPRDQCYVCHYEDLCAAPEATLAEICRFLEVEFDVDQVALPSMPPHMIPGNPMSSRGDRSIRLNEDWRAELSPADLRYFDRHGQRLNARLGYTE